MNAKSLSKNILSFCITLAVAATLALSFSACAPTCEEACDSELAEELCISCRDIDGILERTCVQSWCD